MILSELAHCAIVLVSELVRCRDTGGVTVDQIADRHCVPRNLLDEVITVLESISMVSVKPSHDGDPRLYLKKDPGLLKLEDVVMPFDKESFCGVFLNEENGDIMPQSAITRYINKEREYINKYLRKRYRGINLQNWVEYADKNGKNILYGI